MGQSGRALGVRALKFKIARIFMTYSRTRRRRNVGDWSGRWYRVGVGSDRPRHKWDRNRSDGVGWTKQCVGPFNSSKQLHNWRRPLTGRTGAALPRRDLLDDVDSLAAHYATWFAGLKNAQNRQNSKIAKETHRMLLMVLPPGGRIGTFGAGGIENIGRGIWMFPP